MAGQQIDVAVAAGKPRGYANGGIVGGLDQDRLARRVGTGKAMEMMQAQQAQQQKQDAGYMKQAMEQAEASGGSVESAFKSIQAAGQKAQEAAFKESGFDYDAIARKAGHGAATKLLLKQQGLAAGADLTGTAEVGSDSSPTLPAAATSSMPDISAPTIAPAPAPAAAPSISAQQMVPKIKKTMVGGVPSFTQDTASSLGSLGSLGSLTGLANGGPVRGPSGLDKVPILATKDEYVLPVDTTRKVGKENLDRLVASTHKPVAGAPQGGMVDGGPVGWQEMMFDKDRIKALKGAASKEWIPPVGAASQPPNSYAGKMAQDQLRADAQKNFKQSAAPEPKVKPKVKAPKGKIMKGALGKAGGLVAAGMEGTSVAEDVMTPGMTGLDQVARVGEGAGRLASIGLGAMAGGSVGAFPGALIGGLAGAFAPEATNAAYNTVKSWWGDDSAPTQLPSATAEQLRTEQTPDQPDPAPPPATAGDGPNVPPPPAQEQDATDRGTSSKRPAYGVEVPPNLHPELGQMIMSNQTPEANANDFRFDRMIEVTPAPESRRKNSLGLGPEVFNEVGGGFVGEVGGAPVSVGDEAYAKMSNAERIQAKVAAMDADRAAIRSLRNARRAAEGSPPVGMSRADVRRVKKARAEGQGGISAKDALALNLRGQQLGLNERTISRQEVRDDAWMQTQQAKQQAADHKQMQTEMQDAFDTYSMIPDSMSGTAKKTVFRDAQRLGIPPNVLVGIYNEVATSPEMSEAMQALNQPSKYEDDFEGAQSRFQTLYKQKVNEYQGMLQ